MGGLHEGHLSLMRLARRHADRVVVSLFVNPTQFGDARDFHRYPRNETRDRRLCRQEGVDLCFVPGAGDLYTGDRHTEVRVTGLEDKLEGASRPGHFAGVALVVIKLLHIVETDILILGQKDAQQAVVLETMIRDLDLPVRVIRGRLIRAGDGLALSSRNVLLDDDQRRSALVLSRSLRLARRRIREGERSAARIRSLIRKEFAREPGARLDYADVVDARTLEPVRRLEGRVLLPLAARVGRVRLIDNLELTVSGDSTS